jgi:putative membrane protein
MKRSILVLILGAGFAGTTLAQSPAIAEGDLKFAETVASKGKMEVAVSQHAADHAARPDVKEVAKMMVEEHTKANAELGELAKTKNISLPAEPNAEHKALQDKLIALDGEELDKIYLDEMATGHQSSLDAIAKFKTEGVDADLKAFAEKIEPIVAHHLEMVKNALDGKPIHQARDGEVKDQPAKDPGL